MEDKNATLIEMAGVTAAQTGAWFNMYGKMPYEGVPVKCRATGGTGTVVFTFEFSKDAAAVDASAPVTTLTLSATGAEETFRPSQSGLPRGPYCRIRTSAPTTATDVFAGFVAGDNI